MKPEIVQQIIDANPMLAVHPNAIRAVLTALTATDEYKALVKDAERYRAMRARQPTDYCLHCGYDGLRLIVGDELDAAIDAARGGHE